MTKPFLHFQGELIRRPFPNKASSAQMQTLPLLTIHDHEMMSQFPSHKVPVYINIVEHYRLLAALVEKANQLWSELNILVRFSMPGGTAISPTLLAENVLILQDVSSEESRSSVGDKTLLVIDDNFAHFEIDNGDNRISLRLYGGSKGRQLFLQPLIEVLTKCGVVEI